MLQRLFENTVTYGRHFDHATADNHGRKWYRYELAASVDGYLSMWHSQRSGHSVRTSLVVEELLAGSLCDRAERAVRMRLQNISAIFAENDYPIVRGISPLPHVGQRSVLLEILAERTFEFVF